MRKLIYILSASTLVLGSAVAGEDGHFFRDPVARHKHFREKYIYDSKPEVIEKRDETLSSSLIQKDYSVHSMDFRSLSIKGNKSLKDSEFDFIIKPYLGKKIDDAEVSDIVYKVKKHYKDKGFLLTKVELVSARYGDIHVKVTEGKIRDVNVLVDKKYEKEVLNNNLFKVYIDRILASSPAKTSEVQRAVLLINKIPGYHAQYQLRSIQSGGSKGNELADLVIEIEKSKGKLDFDATDHGSERLGRYQFSAYSQIYNPTKHNDSLLLSMGTSSRPASMFTTSVGYLKRLNSHGTSASILGSYSENNGFRAQRLSAKDDKNKVLRGQVSHYFLLNNKNSIRADIGVDYRDVKEYTNTQLATDYDYVMGFVGAKIKHKDKLGGENWLHPYLYSTLSSANLTRISSANTNFDKNFTFFTLDYFRDQQFTDNFSMFAQVIWHHTGDNLPIEEQFFVGGHAIGRGYKSGLIDSEKGINGDIEFRYTKDVEKGWLNTYQLFAYHDIAKVSNAYQSVSKSTLSSTGAGIRLFMPNGFKGEFEVSIPHTRHVTVGSETHKNRNRYKFLISRSFAW